MHRVFESIDDAWMFALSELTQHGHTLDSRNGGSTEIIGFSFTLSNVDQTLLLNPHRKLSPAYAAIEVLWYLSGEQDVSRLLPYAPSYARFAQPHSLNAHGAYGARWHTNGRDQIQEAITLLQMSPNTRQCVITMWSSDDLQCSLAGGYNDIPCTIALQLFIRESKLHMITTMRSNDAWLGMPYDVFAFTFVQRLIAAELSIECGTYLHQVGSFHLYDRNASKAAEALAFDHNPIRAKLGGTVQSYDNVLTAIMLESQMRSGLRLLVHDIDLALGPTLERELVIACGRKLGCTDATHHSDAFQRIDL